MRKLLDIKNRESLVLGAVIVLIFTIIIGVTVLSKPPADNTNPLDTTPELNVESPYNAPEITGITSWVNIESGISIPDLEGKVVLIDFWTYSCINCIRTLPYLQDWYQKYQKYGLEIIGIHSPEFAFEQKLENVVTAARKYNLTYPIGLDNDFDTWQAYENRYWPAKYFIDHTGSVVHTHFGEGEYAESENIIRYLLEQAGAELPADSIDFKDPETHQQGQSPETYLSYSRGSGFLNATEFSADEDVAYSQIVPTESNTWSLEGDWIIAEQHSETTQPNSKLYYKFDSQKVFLVMSASEKAEVEVRLNGQPVGMLEVAGRDVDPETSIVTVTDSDLYELISLQEFKRGELLELTFPAGVKVYAFTFGK